MNKFTAQPYPMSPSNSSLLVYLSLVEDGRRPQGIRHPLVSVLFGVFLATSAGQLHLTACLEWMKVNYRWLSKIVDFPHGLPDLTTLSRIIGKLKPNNFSTMITSWWLASFGVIDDNSASLDGKAIRCLSGMPITNHILNLFTHHSHLLLGQMGVASKTNEIPVSPKLLSKSPIFGLTITGDALLTQVNIAQAIIDQGANYFLTVKTNRKDLYRELSAGFRDYWLKKQTQVFEDYRKTRRITITIETSQDFDLKSFGFPKLAHVGKITRTGTRIHKGNTTQINEECYFIASQPVLTPDMAYRLARQHWVIENSLHWVKDHVFKEDQHRLHQGNSPEIMSHIRSLVISLINQLEFKNISKTIRQFTLQPKRHLQFAYQAHLL